MDVAKSTNIQEKRDDHEKERCCQILTLTRGALRAAFTKGTGEMSGGASVSVLEEKNSLHESKSDTLEQQWLTDKGESTRA